MWWHNCIQVIFVAYIISCPIIVSLHKKIEWDYVEILLCFDFIFMFDRLIDLFVGFYNPNGFLEHRLSHVLYQNISYIFFLEMLMSVAPLFIWSWLPSSVIYICFKVFRYSRLFEMDS